MGCYRRPDEQGKCFTCASMGCSFFSRFHLSPCIPSSPAHEAIRSLIEVISLVCELPAGSNARRYLLGQAQEKARYWVVMWSTLPPTLLSKPGLAVLVVLVMPVRVSYVACTYFG